MYKKIFFFLVLPFLATSQVQIGQNIDGMAAGDRFGQSVSISSDGSTIAVGAPSNGQSGHVRIFSNVSGNWVQVGNDIVGASSGDRSGWSVSLSADGQTVAVGSPSNNDNGTASGQVRVFENISGVWTQIGNNINGFSGEYSGNSISLSANGETVAVGADWYKEKDNNSPSGIVRVYENVVGTWTQLGTDINSPSGIYSGRSVSLSAEGRTIAIGTPGGESGRVRVYQYNSGVWGQIGNDIDGEGMGDHFGNSVSLSAEGNFVAIGAPYNDENGNASGHVRIYKNTQGTWSQVGNDIDGDALDYFGNSVSLSGDGHIVAIGSPEGDGFTNSSESGYVRVYENISGVWTQIGLDIFGEAINDKSGISVALSSDGNTVAIGANLNDGGGTDSGHVRVYQLKQKSSSSSNFVSQNLKIYPNPTSDVLNISLENNLILEKVTVYNNLGQIVKTSVQNTVDVSTFSPGIYFVEVTTSQGKAVKKVIVK